MLSKLPSGKRIFIDSNIFIYHYLGLIDSCSDLFIRIENKNDTDFLRVKNIKVWSPS